MRTLSLRWQSWKARQTRSRPGTSEPPFRGDLFSADQLARHARFLATDHRMDTRRGSNRLLNRLGENELDLRAFNRATLAVRPVRRITPAAEWLLDNFYLIEEQIQTARCHLPRGYCRELNTLSSGHSIGLPRVYDIALELISHVDAQVDAGPLSAFVEAYQTVDPLKLGELWAIPIMLRLALIENLKRITTRLATARDDRDLADAWVDRLQDMAEKNPSHLVIVVADLAKSQPPLSSSFVAEFCLRLSRQGQVLQIARDWLEQRLVEKGSSIEQRVHQESQNQAADQVSVSQSIASLRFLSAMDWKAFVESLSVVERTLRSDPASVYGAMDFATRDRYRHAVESFARHSRLSELAVAQHAIDLATDSAHQEGREHRTAHVGYYLVDKGRAALERSTKVHWPLRSFAERAVQRFPLAFYGGGSTALTLSAGLIFSWHARTQNLPTGGIIFLSLVFLVCASQFAIALMNGWTTRLAKPRLLPRLDFSAGIPADSRTLVVIPTLLTTVESVDRLLEMCEVHALANQDAHLHFGLLTDFRDATEEQTATDELLLHRIRTGVELLNRKYLSQRSDLFFLFHRPRRWNKSEGLWMGYERKRGKLAELNALLRGRGHDCFSEIVGKTALLPQIRYVITLDSDTQLPRDAARELAGTMAHPLNRPVYDPDRGIVREGYGILQPRVGVSLPSARRSWFVRLFAGDAGIDPYTRAVSDVYQDLFHEGSFVGKGIYDVDAFERTMAGRFPDNKILSHDLLESCHARSALVSDIELYEEFPFRYNVEVRRRHRWIRGDWQIMQWILPWVPGRNNRLERNPLSGLSLWKIADNLRRSLVPICLLLFLTSCWLFWPGLGVLASLLVPAIVALPGLLTVLVEATHKPADLTWRLHARSLAVAAGRQAAQAILTLTFLPYEAFISLDAISRTLIRSWVTHQKLLEWQTSSDAERAARTDLISFCVTMGVSPAIALVTASLLLAHSPTQLWMALPFLVPWLVAPLLACWISRPLSAANPNLTGDQLRFLRHTARKTWSYFETFVAADENWLPPDNFQEIPVPTIATRTSPTNLGLALLANLSAHDLGYLSTGGLVRRTTNTLATMVQLEKYRGHFYNWYDTRTLQPLAPLYVSSVDSGNLAGHLLTLASGLRELADEPIGAPMVMAGMRDTVGVLLEQLPAHDALIELEAELRKVPATLSATLAMLESANHRMGEIVNSLSNEPEPIKAWVQHLKRQGEDHREELLHLAPWLKWLASHHRRRSGAQSPSPLAPGSGDDAGITASIPGLEATFTALDSTLTVKEIAEKAPALCASLEAAFSARPNERPSNADEETKLISELASSVREGGDRARGRMGVLDALARQCDELAVMDFTFLYNTSRDLFSIGYNVAERRCDPSYYDLLASEARLCSFVAIALGQVPQDHWFRLGRLLVASRGEPVLVSWSGSMFEYLMPLLVMPSYENTLLDHSCKAAVKQQMEYGQLRGVPWGVSESGYNLTDLRLNYQYRAFGVPGLGLKRGLADDLVISPYASVMALMVAPVDACENLQRLAAEGRTGSHGFYEAVDYSPARLPPGETSATIRSFMVHHQGMSLVALANLLSHRPMPRRFQACPLFKAADLLLQERTPKTPPNVFVRDLVLETIVGNPGENEGTIRVLTNPSPPVPEVHLLSNGRYHVAISSAGAGYSRWRDLAVTRWREDATRDCWGAFVYLRDLSTGVVGSATHQPTLCSVHGYEAIFSQARVEFRQRYSALEVHTEICVSPEDDVELRRITLTNHSPTVRIIELTSYAEVVLAHAAADAAHPAFSNLFVQTEFIPRSSALLCTRRPRSHEERPPWLLHLMVAQGDPQGVVTCETDRSRFVGRGGNLTHPAALANNAPLSNTVGSVLDPIVSLRRSVSLAPDASIVINLVLGVSENREGALALVEKYQSFRMADRAFELAWTHSQVTLRQLMFTVGEAQLCARLSGALIYADPSRRTTPHVLRNNRRGQSGLWSYGISGDAPIVLLRISDLQKIELVRQVILAHAYWRMKGLTVELIILNEDNSVYRQSLHDQIISLIASGVEAQMLDRPGGIFVRRLEQVPHEDRLLLQSVARIVLDDENGSLAEQVGRRNVTDPLVPALVPTRPARWESPPPAPRPELIFANGLGGFTRDGHEYVITLEPGQTTPAPWVNVLANPSFGTVVSESGSAYTWVENAHEFRLTPWNNDPVQDTSGEAVFIRDEQTGQYWSPTPLPARGTTPYVVRHGFGYTVFEHTENGIASEQWVYVAINAPVKFTVVKLRNLSGRPRRLSLTGYCEWVLGDLRHKTLLHVQTEVDLATGALLARNHYNTEFPDRIAFLDVNDPTRTLTGDRREFLGRNGSPSQPAALKRMHLSGKVGAGLDPCGALQVSFDLSEGQAHEITFRLGVGSSLAEVQDLVRRFRRSDAGRIALEGVRSHWSHTLGAVTVDTPDPSVNVMANGWLLYQTLSCRIWGRTGFYQSGGAYGFRDQLQDVMALIHSDPAITREHVLRAAARQFREGDVQHWWHPPAGRGVRTQFSDDFLWLPYVTYHYVSCVRDPGVLDELIPYLEGRPVKPEEEAYYDLPNRTEESGTLYQHCVRAIERGLRFGVHGLPLMGCGDWNDGMNRVGHLGQGESVWLGFFLYDVLVKFARLAREHKDVVFAERCLKEAGVLGKNLEAHAWDGGWYRRAYFDQGEPLGSQSNQECQIDSLPQSWSVISGAGEASRSRLAMQAVDQRLVRRNAGLIQLFDPPFDHSPLDPGYIKGYIPGVRENGGQYTHGAIWTALAFALLGEQERAWELFTMLNPAHRGESPGKIAVSKVEPYVVAADVYGVAPHTGRGGWTWYTGSAGWMYRLLVETLLGIQLEGGQLRLRPLMPRAWTTFKIRYRHRTTVYRITITRRSDTDNTRFVALDGKDLPDDLIPLVDDHRTHDVELRIPSVTSRSLHPQTMTR